MIRHNDLRAVRNQDLRIDSHILQRVQFVIKRGDIQCNAVPDDIYDMLIAYAGRKKVKCKTPLLINNGMSRVGAPLKANDQIRIRRIHVGDLSFSLVSPVCSYDSSNHSFTS